MSTKPEPPPDAYYHVRFRRWRGEDVWFEADVPGPTKEDAEAQALQKLKDYPQDPADYDVANPETTAINPKR